MTDYLVSLDSSRSFLMGSVICFLLVSKNPSRYSSDTTDVTLKKKFHELNAALIDILINEHVVSVFGMTLLLAWRFVSFRLHKISGSATDSKGSGSF
jgi:hypothetical protein